MTNTKRNTIIFTVVLAIVAVIIGIATKKRPELQTPPEDMRVVTLTPEVVPDTPEPPPITPTTAPEQRFEGVTHRYTNKPYLPPVTKDEYVPMTEMPSPNWRDCEFTFGDSALRLGDPIVAFEQNDWIIDEREASQIVGPLETQYGIVLIKKDTSEYVMVTVYNPYERPVTVEDCCVYSISYAIDDMASLAENLSVGNIAVGGYFDDFIKQQIGKPSYSVSDGISATLVYESEDENVRFTIDTQWDVITRIELICATNAKVLLESEG